MGKEPALNSGDLLLLEQPLLKVPVEGLKRNIRHAQRAADKEFQFCLAAVADLSKGTSSPSQDAVKSVDSMLNRMRGLKRKLSDIAESNTQMSCACKARLDHLHRLSDLDSFSSPQYREWARVRLARQIADHMLRKGYNESAKKLATGLDIGLLVDDVLFKECAAIEASLEQRSATEALAWCKDNQSSLKRISSTIEFDLRHQEFIELVRARKNAEAILYSRKHLVGWGATHLSQIQQALALLAFGPDTTCPPYRKLFSFDNWHTLKVNFRYVLLTLHSLAPLPMLSLAVHTGVAVLKTPSCLGTEPLARNDNCPICTSELNTLARDRSVPWSHHANSTIVCKITLEVMEGENPGREPLALPNGRVYSREALEDLAADNDGKVIDPYTKDEYNFSDTLKVFIS